MVRRSAASRIANASSQAHAQELLLLAVHLDDGDADHEKTGFDAAVLDRHADPLGLGIGVLVAELDPWRKDQLRLFAALRLLAFFVTLLAVARPSLGRLDQEAMRSQVIIALDYSRSMTVQDERGGQSRWNLALKQLQAAGPVLDRLRDQQQVDVLLYRFADELSDFTLDDPGEPDGKRTDIGGMLRSLFDRRDPRLPLRGMLLLSDGADNGGVPALAEAGRYRGLGAGVHTFAVGNPGTTPKHNDAAITSIATSPTPGSRLRRSLMLMSA